AVDAGSDSTDSAVWLVTLISTVPSGSVITVGVTVALVVCRHADRLSAKRITECIRDPHPQRVLRRTVRL
ncbi:hypothetical protein HMPREF0986_04650, partial [Escherichia coli 4_1_47FAA]